MRALFAHVLGPRRHRTMVVEEPACGEGHMAYALADYFDTVRASDVHPYGYGAVRDFLDVDAWADIERPDWIVTNPPFGPRTVEFMRRGLDRAGSGLALLVRTTQLEGMTRYKAIYRQAPPAIVAPFVERVPLHKGRWEPDGDTQTAYMWMVWRTDRRPRQTQVVWIPPCRRRLTYIRDIERFAAPVGGIPAAEWGA